MENFVGSVFSILIQIFGIALLAVITFTVAKSVYKPSFTKKRVGYWLSNTLCHS